MLTDVPEDQRKVFQQAIQDRIDAGVVIAPGILPRSVSSIDGIPLDSKALDLIRVGSSHLGIARFRSLTCLSVRGVNQRVLDEICDIPTLDTLRLVCTPRALDLSRLARLPKLRRLILDGPTQMRSLDWASNLGQLDALAMMSLPRVGTLDPLATLPGLHALAIEGSMWTAMRVTTLAPLGHLTQLRYLFMTALRVEDSSLAPLRGLSELRVLDAAYYFPMEECARLSAHLRTTRSNLFEACSPSGRCPKCEDDSLVFLTGNSRRLACRRCDAERVDAHLREFARLAGHV